MTESSKTASAAAQSVLLPQGDHAGKPGLPLGSRPFTLVGSRNRAHLHLLSTTISRSHACIIASKSGMYVRDLASRTGVLVNGRKVKEMDLQDGDMLEVGSFKFRFQEPLGAIHLATTPRPPLAMLEAAGGKLMPLDDRSILIGRRPTCEILLDAATVSSTHAIIFECDGQRYIRDLGSRTGTHINGELVHQQVLHSGDQIRIGDSSFRYVSSDAPPEELDEDSDTAALTANLVEEDELAPMPVPIGHEEDELAHATDVDDPAPLHADHPERPADPFAAEQIQHEPIPLASNDDELLTATQELQAEQSAAPVEPQPEPAANGESAVADDELTEWLPIDFTEIDQPVTDVAAPIAEQSLTAPVDVLKEEEPDLDVWQPATDTPIDVVSSEVAHETPRPVEPEPVTAEAKEIAASKAEPLPINETPAAIRHEPIAIEPAVVEAESIESSPVHVSETELPPTEIRTAADAIPALAEPEEEPAELDALADLELLDLEDVPGEYPPSPVGESDEPLGKDSAPADFDAEPTTAEPQAALSHEEPSLAPTLKGLEETAGEFDLSDTAAPVVAPPAEVGPRAESEKVAVLDESSLIEEHEPVAAPEPAAVEDAFPTGAQAPALVEQQPAPLAELVVQPGEVSAPAITPATAAPEAVVAAAEPVTAIELGSEVDAAALVPSQGQHDEIVVPPLAVVSPAESRDGEPPSVDTVIPLNVEAVDLSAVTFEASSPTTEAADASAQLPPESSSAPQPLLDLAPAPQAEIALEDLSAPVESTVEEWGESTADENAGTATEPASSEKKGRKPRAPRKKPPAPRRASRRKKGEEVQEALAATDVPQDLEPVAEAVATEATTTVVAGELVTPSPGVQQSDVSEPAAAAHQPITAEVVSAASAAEHTEHDVADFASIAEAPVVEPLFKLGNSDLMRVEVPQVAAEAEPVAPESEPIIAQPAAEELATDAFYSGPAHEAPLVSVDVHERPEETTPAMAGVTAQAPVGPEPEILSFEAAATTPEAKEVMAAWHDTESSPTAYEAQTPSSGDSLPALPAPTAMTSEASAVEPILVEPSVGESASPITAWVHENTVPLEAPAAADTAAPAPEAATDLGVETIESTEPTVESALDLEPSLAQVSTTSSTPDLVEVDTTLTDTAFGRAVSDFSGSGLGPMVEEASPSPHPALSDPDLSMSFDHVLEDLPEFVMPAASNGEQADFMDVDFFNSEVFETNTDSGDLSAANLSTDLSGEVATPPQTLTLGEIADEPATVHSTAHASDVTLTSTHEIGSSQTADDDEFIAIGEDALIEPLDFDEQQADELPEIDIFGAAEVESESEPIVAEQPPAEIANEVPAPTPASVVGEAPTPTPAHIIAETPAPASVVAEALSATPPAVAEAPAPAPAQPQQPVKPPPLNPYFGMERDSGSFLGGMPLSFNAPLREPPRGPAARPQNDRLPPPRLAPASAPETASTPRSPFALISPVAPIQGLAPAPAFDPFQAPAARPETTPVQPQEPAEEVVEKTSASEPVPTPQVAPVEDISEPDLLTDELAEGPQAGAAALEDPDDILFQAEEPIELFDGTADKLDDLPDALDAIDDLEGALAGPESAEVSEPAKSTREAAATMAATTVKPAPEAAAPASAPTPATPPAAAAPPKSNAPSLFAAFSSMTSIAPPLQSLTGAPTPAKAAGPAAPVTVPPFAGSRPNARGSANPFAGMATPPPKLNTTDIFSQTTFPPPDEAMFRPQPIDIPPMKVRTPGVDPSATPKRQNPRQESDSRPGQHAAPLVQGQTSPQPPHKPAAPTPAKKEPKKKWWQSIRLLLPLMLLIMSTAVVAIVRLFPPRTLVQGTLQIKGLDQLNPMQRKDQIRSIRELLTKPDLRNTVVGSLATQAISPGFTQDAMALGRLADPENSPSDQNLLVFKRISTDPRDDQKRMQALLLAVYSESKTPSDQARAAGDLQVKAAEDTVAALQTQYDAEQAALQKLTDQLRAATGASAREVLQNPTAAIATLQRQHEQLGTALADANAKVKSARDVLNRTQNATAALPETVADPQLAGMQQTLNGFNARLTSAQVPSGPALQTASQAFDDSLQSLDQDLMLVALSARNPVASSYAARARQATTEMRDLLARQKQDRDAIDLLKGQFADRREAYLIQVWANDETLKGLLGERDAQARRYRTAFDAANADEGAAARTEVSRLDQKIDARRRELATGGQFADSVSQKLQQAIDRLAIDRQENNRRMASDLAVLDVPPAKNLPASEQGSMASVGERVAAVQAARDQYSTASDAAKSQGGDGQTQAIQEEIAEQWARMDAYQQQVQVDPPLLAKARQSLASAQDVEAKAQLAYADNLDLLASARELTDAQARVTQSRAAVATARTDLETQRSQAGNFVQLQSPDDAAAQIIYEPDQRHWYMIGALAGVAILFAGPIWLGLREPQPRAPFAMIINESEGADDDLEEFHEINAIEDEGHAAAV